VEAAGVEPASACAADYPASGRDALAQAWWIATAPGLLLATVILALRAAAGSILSAPEPPSLA